MPGGYAPDKLRRYPAVLELVRGIADKGGVVGAICHAAWVPISAGVVKGKRARASPRLRTTSSTLAAHYVDEAVVVDGYFVTSRTPADLPAWLPALIDAIEATK